MKRLIRLLTGILLFMAPGCFAPVNLTFDHARMLKKKEMKVQASYSSYYGPDFNVFSDDHKSGMLHYTNNYGLTAGYGLSEKVNLGLRYENMEIRQQNIEIFDEVIEMQDATVHYLEFGGKVRLVEDYLALRIPFGIYFMEGESISMLDPGLYYNYRPGDNFEFTVSTKAHIMIADGVGFTPGFSMGLGISNNLNRWAFRPEIGYDGYLSFGFGLDFRFNKAEK